MKISFTLPIIPKAQERSRAGVNKYTGHAQVFTSKAQAKNQKDLIALMAPYAPAKPLEGPLKISINVFLPVPQSWSKAKKAKALNRTICPTSRPDLDNYVKQIMDRMTKLFFWVDDSQVIRISASKLYSENPCWQIELCEI